MVKKILIYALILLTVISSGFLLSPTVRSVLLSSGLINEQISIAGTGSMYPTFPKSESKDDLVSSKEIVAWPKMKRYPSGIKIFDLTFFPYEIKQGDIVEFENEKTRKLSLEKYKEEAGFVKRVIGLPGDKIELRDGYVKLNGSILDEPYIAKPRSTYGGDYLPDCKQQFVPPGFVFVMGDNRKASLDSRYELELISITDINYVLPWDEQEEYRSLWRDTRKDMLLANTTTLDAVWFVTLLNNKRKEKNMFPYKYNVLLENSSKLRGYAMISANDFSTEATKSGMSLREAVSKSGYQNILLAELFTRGFYDAQELFENFNEFPEAQKMLYSQDYQDIGLFPALGEVAGCPVQVVVLHLGGYVPPNYTHEQIESWQKLVNNLEKVLPSWESLKNAEGTDQAKVSRLLSLFNTRLSNAKKILSKMSANQWLTDEEKKMASDDKILGEEAEQIISELVKH